MNAERNFYIIIFSFPLFLYEISNLRVFLSWEILVFRTLWISDRFYLYPLVFSDMEMCLVILSFTIEHGKKYLFNGVYDLFENSQDANSKIYETIDCLFLFPVELVCSGVNGIS